MQFYYRPSFKRSFKHLGFEQRKIIGVILEALVAYYSSECNLLEAKKTVPQFFYKQLRRPYYEAGVESDIRVVIKKEEERYIAVLAGGHDQIRQFLVN